MGIFWRAPCILGSCDVAVMKIDVLSSFLLKGMKSTMNIRGLLFKFVNEQAKDAFILW